jgi:thiol-disulfide isomerase/thioredoxin
MSGNAVDLRAYKDKPLIINAWATWSPFSRAELTTLASLKREFGDAFEVIAINRKESPATIAAYLEQIGDISGITFLQDESDQFFGTVSGYAMPESVFYNREGNTVAHVRGTMTEAEMRENIARMLAQRNDE